MSNECPFFRSSVRVFFYAPSIIDRSLQLNTGLHLCFLDYTKAFDRVRYEDMTQEAEKGDIESNDMRGIKNVYWKKL